MPQATAIVEAAIKTPYSFSLGAISREYEALLKHDPTQHEEQDIAVFTQLKVASDAVCGRSLMRYIGYDHISFENCLPLFLKYAESVVEHGGGHVSIALFLYDSLASCLYIVTKPGPKKPYLSSLQLQINQKKDEFFEKNKKRILKVIGSLGSLLIDLESENQSNARAKESLPGIHVMLYNAVYHILQRWGTKEAVDGIIKYMLFVVQKSFAQSLNFDGSFETSMEANHLADCITTGVGPSEHEYAIFCMPNPVVTSLIAKMQTSVGIPLGFGADPDSLATQQKEAGNKKYQEKDYLNAITKYTIALKLATAKHPEMAILYSNRAQAFIQVKAWAQAKEDLEEALKVNPKHAKSLERMILVEKSMEDEKKEREAKEKLEEQQKAQKEKTEAEKKEKPKKGEK
jgi:tetratricopeptide (TPR) repeat protein